MTQDQELERLISEYAKYTSDTPGFPLQWKWEEERKLKESIHQFIKWLDFHKEMRLKLEKKDK